MKWLIAIALTLVVPGCMTSAEEPTGAHGAAIDFAAGQGQLVDANVVSVSGPLPGTWDQWCGLESTLKPCLALQAMTIDLAAPFDEAERADIAAAVGPAPVEFVGDAPGVLTFGRAIEIDGAIYLPLDGQGKGWLFEATSTGDGWEINPLAEWIG